VPDYIPGADPSFDVWQANFISVVNANLAGYGLVAADMTPIVAAQTTWNAALPAHQTAATAAQAAREAKDAARSTLEAAVRAVVRAIQATPTVTDAAKAAAGITVPDSVPTPSGPPTTAPVGKVDTSVRLQHTVHFTDSATPTAKAKPAGVMGCEVWVKVGGPPPVDAPELHFLGLDTRTPYVAEFDGADAGKPAHYMLRWVNKQGEPGPWSATVTATIAG
jgi:hypothetical protein